MSARQVLKNIRYIMTEMDFEKLVKLSEVATSPQVQQNALSIEGLVKQMNNVEKIITTVDKFIKMVETSPSISAAVRIAAKQNGVSLEPLRTVIPEISQAEREIVKPQYPSDTHKQMFEELAKIPEEQLKQMLEAQKAGTQTPK